MIPVAAYLRLHNITVFPYIDDWLRVAKSHSTGIRDTTFVLQTLAELGLQVNHKKSHLQPSQTVDYIGAHLNSTVARVFTPPE